MMQSGAEEQSEQQRPREVPLLGETAAGAQQAAGTDVQRPHPSQAAGTIPSHTASARQPPKVGPRALGWLAFWVLVMLTALCQFMCALVFPDVAAAAFGGGVDPCAGEGRGSKACEDVVERISTTSAVFGTISSCIVLFGAPFIGTVSDAVGSKRMLVGSMLLGLLSCSVFVGVALYHVSIYFSFCCMELLTILPAKMLFQIWIAEQVPPEERLQMFSRLGAALSFEAIGTALAAQFANVRQVVTVALGLQVVSVLLCLCIPSARGRPAQVRLPTPGHTPFPRGANQCIIDTSGLRRLLQNSACRLVMVITMVGVVIESGIAAIFVLYLKERFGAVFKDFALVVMASTVSKIFIQVFLAGPLNKRLGIRGIILLCSSLGVVAQVSIAMAPSLPLTYPGIILMSATCLVNSSLAALLINIATGGEGSHSVGASVGVLASTVAIPGVVGPLLFRIVFFVFLRAPRPFPAAALLLGSAFTMVNIILVFWIPNQVFTASVISAQPLRTA